MSMCTCNICSINDVDWHFENIFCSICAQQIIVCQRCYHKYLSSGVLFSTKHFEENHTQVNIS